jgi:hypothetical protein
VYEGQWKADKRDGEGKLTYADGGVYEGQFKADKMDGLGLHTVTNGDVYEEEWKEGGLSRKEKLGNYLMVRRVLDFGWRGFGLVCLGLGSWWYTYFASVDLWWNAPARRQQKQKKKKKRKGDKANTQTDTVVGVKQQDNGQARKETNVQAWRRRKEEEEANVHAKKGKVRAKKGAAQDQVGKETEGCSRDVLRREMEERKSRMQLQVEAEERARTDAAEQQQKKQAAEQQKKQAEQQKKQAAEQQQEKQAAEQQQKKQAAEQQQKKQAAEQQKKQAAEQQRKLAAEQQRKQAQVREEQAAEIQRWKDEQAMTEVQDSCVTLQAEKDVQARDEARVGDGGDSDMPDDVMCPITLELMQVPVIAEDGHTYERSAIEDWFKRGNRNSPKTQARIGQKLMLNHSMKALIESTVRAHRARKVK